MTRCGLVGVSVFLVFGLVSMAGVAAAGTEEDVAAIDKIREMEAASLNNADPSQVASIYSADVEYIPPGEPALKGTDAVRSWLTGMLEQFEGNLEYTSSDVTILGDWAFEQYAATATLTPKDGGEELVEHARGIHIYHRGEDRSWKITHDVWNYDAPPTE